MSLIIDIALIIAGVLCMYAFVNGMQRHIMAALDNFRDRDRVNYHVGQAVGRLASMLLLTVALGVFF